MARRALITGITGQDGSYLAELLLEKGYQVFGVRPALAARETSSASRHLSDRITLLQADLLDQMSHASAPCEKAEPNEVYNLGGPVLRPDLVRAAGADRRVHRAWASRGVLEAIRKLRPDDPLLPGLARARCSARCARCRRRETTPFHPRSPYARGQGLRPLHHRQLPRELRPVRGQRHPLQPRSRRAAAESS